MRTIRRNCFETNSSSTHSICISKDLILNIPDRVEFNIGNFGWECANVNKADYLYTSIMTLGSHKELLDKLKEILKSHNIKYKFGKAKFNKFGLANGNIDHCCSVNFVNDVINDDNRCMRYLFGNNSYVWTGNDNCGDNEKCYCKCRSCSKEMYIYDNNEHLNKLQNPYYDETKYEYYYKGN